MIAETRSMVLRAPWVVVYAYPRTGVPDVESPPGWNAIPGADTAQIRMRLFPGSYIGRSEATAG